MEISIKETNKQKLGQYFTPEIVANFMINLADISPKSSILEPSCGEGVFLRLLKEKGFKNLRAYEIDRDLAKDFSCVHYESFVSATINQRFDLIIGNPPYIRWKNLEEELKLELSASTLWNKYFNSLCDYLYIFILKSIDLLNENGQLIFICPKYWMNTTHSLSLRNYMIKHGYFEEIYHFNETPIFEKVTVSIIIFKFIKSKKTCPTIRLTKFKDNKKLTPSTLIVLERKKESKGVEYIDINQFKLNERWLLVSNEEEKKLLALENSCLKKEPNSILNLFYTDRIEYNTIGEYCDIGNGMVRGLDKAFQLNGHLLNEEEKISTINVLKAKDLNPYYTGNITKYIFLTDGLNEKTFIANYPNFYEHLQSFKDNLEKRYQYNRKINYWEWVFLRNFNLFSKKEKRIFVPCKERISNKRHFRFSLVEEGIYPTQDVTAIFKKQKTKESIEYIVAYLNHSQIFDWLKTKGIIKGSIVEFSEKPIASIPFKAIDWTNKKEVDLHDIITKKMIKYLDTKQDAILDEINQLIDQLIKKQMEWA